MDTNQLLSDAAARKQAERNAAMTWPARIASWRDGFWSVCKRGWVATPVAIRSALMFAASCVALGFLCVMTYWELTNAGSGYALIFAGWGGVAFLGGVSVAGFYMWGHRQEKENQRTEEEQNELRDQALSAKNELAAEAARKTAKAAKKLRQRWRTISTICFIVTAIGVFSNLVSHASMDTSKAIEIEEDRNTIRKTIRQMKAEHSIMPKPTGVEDVKETLNQYLAEAAGWKLPDLDAETTCKVNFEKRRPRDLCNLASSARAQIKEAEGMQADLDKKLDEIKAEEKKLAALQPVAGAKHYQQMAKLILSMPGVPSDWEEASIANAIQIWVVLFLSLGGLYVCALGWDSVGERAEGRKKKPAPVVQLVAKG